MLTGNPNPQYLAYLWEPFPALVAVEQPHVDLEECQQLRGCDLTVVDHLRLQLMVEHTTHQPTDAQTY